MAYSTWARVINLRSIVAGVNKEKHPNIYEKITHGINGNINKVNTEMMDDFKKEMDKQIAKFNSEWSKLRKKVEANEKQIA